MKQLIIFSAVTLLFTACDWGIHIGSSLSENEIYYHDVEIEGYVYYQDEPVNNVGIFVRNNFKHTDVGTIFPIEEKFTTDTNGHFYAKLIRRADGNNVISHGIEIGNDTLHYDSMHNEQLVIFMQDIRNAKENIKLGKFNLTRKRF